MKVRKDFVTNSSSSSFIIAKKKNCTIDEIRNNLRKYKSDIKDTLEIYNLDSDDVAIELFINELANELFAEPNNLKLGEWTASSVEYSNENSEFEAFMYDYGGKLGTENFKVG